MDAEAVKVLKDIRSALWTIGMMLGLIGVCFGWMMANRW